MPRQELHSESLTIEQKPDISDDPADYDGDIVLVDAAQLTKDYEAALAFMEEPVTIRLQPSAEKNAAMALPVTINGKPAEVFQRGRWEEVGYLPVNRTLTVKRKVLEVIIRAKVDTINTLIDNPESDNPNNRVSRFTSPLHSFSILEDKNPRGADWCAEMMRRNYVALLSFSAAVALSVPMLIA